MWGLPLEFIDVLEKGFEKFLEFINPEDIKAEYLLPKIIGEMLEQQRVQVKVLESHDQWFGVTYKEDKESVVGSIRQLIGEGVYPEKLYK